MSLRPFRSLCVVDKSRRGGTSTRKLILRTAAKSEILLGADLRAAIRLGVGVVLRAVIFAFDQATLQKLEDSSRMKILGDGASRLRLYLCMSGIWGG